MQMTVPRPREQALEQIMAYILENKLSADDKLPPEREMCQMWGVNRCTLRSAIAAGDPVFWIVSITQTSEGVPVEYCRTVARADKVELVSVLHRGESEASDHA